MHDMGRYGCAWTIAGSVPMSVGIIDEVFAAPVKGFTFLQISDSHVGFDKPANPNVKGTLEEASARVKTLPMKPSFMIHTGDISHLSKASEFDDADSIIAQSGLNIGYLPAEPARNACRQPKPDIHSWPAVVMMNQFVGQMRRQ
jgi:hypothetical protein